MNKSKCFWIPTPNLLTIVASHFIFIPECILVSFNLSCKNLSSLSQVDYIPYADELANQVGCKPNLVKLFFSDPTLALRCFFGPCTPVQYRLMGPGAWKGAKKAIEDAPGNVIYATKTRVLLKKEEQAPNTPAVYLMFLVLFVVLVSIFLQFLQNT